MVFELPCEREFSSSAISAFFLSISAKISVVLFFAAFLSQLSKFKFTFVARGFALNLPVKFCSDDKETLRLKDFSFEPSTLVCIIAVSYTHLTLPTIYSV